MDRISTHTLLLCSILPSIATVITAYLLLKIKSRSAYPLFINLFALSFIQAFGYWTAVFSSMAFRYFPDVYLIGIYYFFANIIIFALQLSDKNYRLKYWIYLVPTILTVLHVTGFMIDSYRWEQNTLMHNDGPLAWTFDLFALCSLIACVAILLINTKQLKDYRLKSKNIIMLYSFIPVIVVIGCLAMLSMTPYAVSTTIVAPIIFIYTSITYYYIAEHRVVECSVGITFFLGRLKLAYQVLTMDNNAKSINAHKKNVADHFIAESLRRNNNRPYATAKEMNLHYTTIRSRVKETN